MSSGTPTQAESARRSPAATAATLAVLLLLWAVFLRNGMDGQHSFALDMDNEFFIGAVLSSMSNALAHGIWPLRMDTVMGGLPLYNSPQLSPLYPFYFASLPIFRTPAEVVHSMHWITLAHVLLLQVNTYVFMRAIGASRIGAVLGAALFAFSANSNTYAAWLNITAPYAWFPLYLAGLVGMFRHPGRVRDPAIALVAIVLLTFASPAQPLIHAVVVSAVFVVAYWTSHGLAQGWQHTRRPLATLVAVGVIAVLIVSPALIPAAAEFKDMIRWIGDFPPVVGNAPIPFEAFQVDQLSVPRLTGIFFRQVGAAVGSPYVGVIGLALAAAAAVSTLRSWITRALVFIAIYAIVSSTGINLGLAYVNYVVPMLNKIREPSRFLVLFQFAIAALAALGIDQLRRMVASPRSVDDDAARRIVIAMLFVAAVGLAVMLGSDAQVIGAAPPWVYVLALVALIGLTVAWRRHPSRYADSIVGVVWAAAALTFLATDVRWQPAPITASKYDTGGGRELDKVFDRIVELDPQRQYRVVFDGKVDKQMASMLASYKRIRSLNAYFNPAPHRQFEALYYHGQRSPNYFQALGARYLVCEPCTAEAVRGYTMVERIGRLFLYEAPQALPHSRLLTHVDGRYSDIADFGTKAASADLSKGLLYVQAADAAPELPQSRADCASRERRRSVVRMRMETRCDDPGVLVINDFYDSSWRPSVDGKPVPLLRVNGTQMAVAVPAGSHVIDLRYRPASFFLSVPVAGLGVLLAIAGGLFLWRRGRKTRR
ncbi:YfhO family protein [Variovorax sp. KK3]|uniref:YfhO family protein n=1 Tax=Variovorax sp. KK3 TaxID=1855728 RepID=UPI00097BD114|nr:YfhO family protein [Variovorax sp. KK3]